MNQRLSIITGLFLLTQTFSSASIDMQLYVSQSGAGLKTIDMDVYGDLSFFGGGNNYYIDWYVHHATSSETFLDDRDYYPFTLYPDESKSCTVPYGGLVYVEVELMGPDYSTSITRYESVYVPGSADLTITSGPTVSGNNSYAPITVSGWVKNDGDAPPSTSAIYIDATGSSGTYYLGYNIVWGNFLPGDSMSFSVTDSIGLPPGYYSIEIYHDAQYIGGTNVTVNGWDIQLEQNLAYSNLLAGSIPTVTAVLKNHGPGNFPYGWIGTLIYDASSNLYSEGWSFMYAADAGDSAQTLNITPDTALVEGWNYIGIWDQTAYDEGLNPWIGGEWKYVYAPN